jgi:hypothetical protein
MPGARCTRGLACKMKKENAHEHTGSAEAIRHSLRNGFTAYAALLCPQNLPECANGRLLTQPPVAGSEPVVLKGRKSLTGSEGLIRCLPQPEQLHGLRARTEQGRELDDGTKRFDCRRY